MSKSIYPKRYDSFIGGKFHHSSHCHRINISSPITGAKLYDIPNSEKLEVDLAVCAAEKGFKKWSMCSTKLRANILNKVATIIQQNKQLLAELEVYDTGKFLTNAVREVELASQYFNYFASCIVTQEGSATQIEDTLSINLYEPLGKIGIILPWNFPLLMFCWKVAPAIAAGNAVVVKPSEYATLSIIKLMELIATVIPKGVINIILGSGDSTGLAMGQHDGFDKFSFTGGVETGKKVSQTVAKHLTPITLELGGKSPCIVTANACQHGEKFLDSVVKTILSFTYNQGQICGNLSRLLLERSIAKMIIKKIKSHLQKLSVGDPRLPVNSIGPVISQQRKNAIVKQINLAETAGAAVTGFPNTINLSADSEGGYYLSPYLIEGEHYLDIFQNEIFGPVLCISTFDTLEEAVTISNGTIFGLTASVWSRDIKEINYLTKNIVAGKIWVNASHLYYPHTKFGGMKKSGHGNEMCKLAVNEFQKIKNIMQHY